MLHYLSLFRCIVFYIILFLEIIRLMLFYYSLILQCATALQIVEEHHKPFRGREDPLLPGSGVRPALLQALPPLRHG